jgi:hypothetical protein
MDVAWNEHRNPAMRFCTARSLLDNPRCIPKTADPRAWITTADIKRLVRTESGQTCSDEDLGIACSPACGHDNAVLAPVSICNLFRAQLRLSQ